MNLRVFRFSEGAVQLTGRVPGYPLLEATAVRVLAGMFAVEAPQKIRARALWGQASVKLRYAQAATDPLPGRMGLEGS
jgi:hypothetical protein